jgi:hypothetical protein
MAVYLDRNRTNLPPPPPVYPARIVGTKLGNTIRSAIDPLGGISPGIRMEVAQRESRRHAPLPGVGTANSKPPQPAPAARPEVRADFGRVRSVQSRAADLGLQSNIPAAARGARKTSNIVQRVVLHDVNIDDLRDVDGGLRYLHLREYIDQYEIYKSAVMLGNLYGMKVYPIRVPKDIGLKATIEPMILVGHGGGGRFMPALNEEEIIQYLQGWGMTKGTKTVLAGCNTAEAASLIGKIKAITEVEPVTNQSLAFTVAQSEYVIEDKPGLFDERNKALQAAESQMMTNIANELKGWLEKVDAANYQDAVIVVDHGRQKVLGAKKSLITKKDFSPASGQQLLQEWDKICSRFMANLKGEEVEKRIKVLRELLKTLVSENELSSQMRDRVRTLLNTGLPELFSETYKHGKGVMQDFLSEIRKKAKLTSYLLRTGSKRPDPSLWQYYKADVLAALKKPGFLPQLPLQPEVKADIAEYLKSM